VSFWGLFAGLALIFWPFAFWSLYHTTAFGEGSKTAWFWVILLAPVAGSIAYWSAKRNVERYSRPDPTRLGHLLDESPDPIHAPVMPPGGRPPRQPL
jgi:hypothetical protein